MIFDFEFWLATAVTGPAMIEYGLDLMSIVMRLMQYYFAAPRSLAALAMLMLSLAC